MKKFHKLALISVVFTSSCVHGLQPNSMEGCANSGMVVSGVSYGTSNAVTTMGGSEAFTKEKSEGFTCSRPQTAEEKCERASHLAALNFKNSYNSENPRGLRNTLIGVGYVFLWPGLIGYVYFSGEEKHALRDAQLIQERSYNQCINEGPKASK